jgi:hypothetical protein
MTPSISTEDAIKKANGRQELADLLGVASITTYRWQPNIPESHVYKLYFLRPDWFKAKTAARKANRKVAAKRAKIRQHAKIRRP